jgi:hypothetical protein
LVTCVNAGAYTHDERARGAFIHFIKSIVETRAGGRANAAQLISAVVTEAALLFGGAYWCFGLFDAAAFTADEDVRNYLLRRNQRRSGPSHLDVTVSADWRY